MSTAEAVPESDPSVESTSPRDPHVETLRTLYARFGDGVFTTSLFRDNLRLYVRTSHLIEILEILKHDCGFELLSELGGVDYLGYPGRTRERFEVHYILLNLETSERIVVKVGVNDPAPVLPSVMGLWLGANWMEREVFDLYGITFEGHPDLRRILMPDEFVAHPLRKDYPLRGRGERHNFPQISRGES